MLNAHQPWEVKRQVFQVYVMFLFVLLVHKIVYSKESARIKSASKSGPALAVGVEGEGVAECGPG